MSDDVVVRFPGPAVRTDPSVRGSATEVHPCGGVPVRFEGLPEIGVVVPRAWSRFGGLRAGRVRGRRLRAAIVEAGLEVVSMLALDGEAAEVAIRPDRRLEDDGPADPAMTLVVEITRKAS